MNSNGKFQDHIRRLFITHLQLTELDLLIFFIFFPTRQNLMRLKFNAHSYFIFSVLLPHDADRCLIFKFIKSKLGQEINEENIFSFRSDGSGH